MGQTDRNKHLIPHQIWAKYKVSCELANWEECAIPKPLFCKKPTWTPPPFFATLLPRISCEIFSSVFLNTLSVIRLDCRTLRFWGLYVPLKSKSKRFIMIIRIAHIFALALVFDLLLGVRPAIGEGLLLPKSISECKTETQKTLAQNKPISALHAGQAKCRHQKVLQQRGQCAQLQEIIFPKENHHSHQSLDQAREE